MDYSELYALTMDVIQKYGRNQYNLGQLNMVNMTGSPGDVHLEEVRRKAQANSEAAITTLDNTVRTMCGIEQQPDRQCASCGESSWLDL